MKKNDKLRAAVTSLVLAMNAVVLLFPAMQTRAVDAGYHKQIITSEHIVSMQNFFLNNTANVKMEIDEKMDMDGSGTVDAFDLAIMKRMYGEQQKQSEAFYDNVSDLMQKYDGNNEVSADTTYTSRIIVKAFSAYDFSTFSPRKVVEGPDFLYVVQFGSIMDTEKCLSALRKDENIDYAELDRKIEVELPETEQTNAAMAMQEDYYSWGVTSIEADQYAEYLSEYHDSSVIVAVVDSGVAKHPFLEEKLMEGYDFVDNDSDPDDLYYHGTHVAGTVADCMRGLDVKIMPVRVLDEYGFGSNLSVGNGVMYAVDHGANIINLSLGGACSKFVDYSIEYALKHGVTVVAAAGNSATNTVHHCPAHCEDAIVVAASDISDQRAGFSNYGNSVDVIAPGVAISSTMPDGSLGKLNGTSMATPHISASAAMIKYANPKATPAEIEALLKEISLDLGDPGRDAYYGYGLPKLSNLIPDNPDFDPSITISETAVSLNAGDKYILAAETVPSAQTITWSTSDDAVVSVDGGSITALSKGTAVISASFVYNSITYTAECTVTVEDESENILIEGQCGDDVYYTLDGNGLLTLSGTGAMWDYSAVDIFELSKHTHGESPFKNNAEIKAVAVSEGVTSLGDCVFVGCSQLKDVSLPESLTHIENHVFHSCTSLEEIYIPQNVEKIGDTEYVYDVRDGVNWRIPTSTAEVFADCPALKGVYVDDNNLNIGDDNGALISGDRKTLFFIPLSLNEYVMSDELTELADNCAENHQGLTELIVPDSVVTIGAVAFKGCTNLTNLQLNAGLETISEAAFAESGITAVHIPSSVTEIESYAFGLCKSLSALTFDSYGSESLIIDHGAFAYSAITNVVLPERTDAIAAAAFRCYDLKSVEVLKYNTVIADVADTLGTSDTVIYGYAGSSAQQYAALADQEFVAFEEQIEIPTSGALNETVTWNYADGLLTISGVGEMPDTSCVIYDDDYIIYHDRMSPWWIYRNEIKKIEIEEGITLIADGLFAYCYNLEEVLIPPTVEHIGFHAFALTGIKEITIPETVSTVSSGAFACADKLEKITFYNRNCSINNSNRTIPETTVIYGYTGSTAEAYANEFNRTFVAID